MNGMMPGVLTCIWKTRLAVAAASLLTACGATETPRATVADHPASVTSAPVTDPQAIAALAEGERQIEVAAGDCASACAGLSKIMHARLQLCSPRTSACTDAEKRDDDATKRVFAFCGACPKVGP